MGRKRESIFSERHYKAVVEEAYKELGATIKHCTARTKEKHCEDTTTFSTKIPTTMNLEIVMLKKKYNLRNIDFVFHGLDSLKKHIRSLKGRKGVEFLAKMEKEITRLNNEAGDLMTPALNKRRHKY